MQTALDLCMVWSLYGLYMCKHFWPSPVTSPAELGPGGTIKWPRQSHPSALTPEGRARTPWVTSWARATFEQGILSVLPMLTGPCTVASLPGEHLFQASALPRNRMRPAIFHAFGKAKVGAQDAPRELEQQGWETLPIAILGMPNLPPAWVIETWKPVGGCKFTGYFSGVAGNSALRFCLLLKWRAIRPRATELFPAQLQVDSLSCLPAEDGDADVESVSTPSSDTSARRADRLTKAIERDLTRRRVVRHQTLVHALSVRNGCLLPSLCPGVKSPSYEGLLQSTRTLKHVRMSNCKLLWLTPSVLSREKKSSFYKPIMTCSVNSKARLCLWKVLRHKFLKLSTSVSKVKYYGSLSCG